MGEIIFSVVAGMGMIIPGIILYILIEKEERKETCREETVRK